MSLKIVCKKSLYPIFGSVILKGLAGSRERTK